MPDMIVCIKQVIDPEAPPSAFQIDEKAKKALPPKTEKPFVISPFDEQAVEAALRIKDAHGGKVTVISLGAPQAVEIIKHAIAMGADEGILISDPALEDVDSFMTAMALSAAIKKIGKFDLIFCGRQAADWDHGQVGSGIAEILGIPCVTIAKAIEYKNGKALVERVLADGFETVEVELPALITVSNELGEPRYPTLKRIMMAAKAQVPTWTAKDIGFDPSLGMRVKIERLYIPVREAKCEFVGPEDDPEAAGANLALKLKEAKLL